MRLGLQLGYDDPRTGVALAQEADRLGFHSVWTSEAYGTDAVTPMAWIAATTGTIAIGSAIMQMPARSPAATASTVATLDLLTGGRVLLGLGTSGPQVAEGWHGQAWGKPLTRTREYVEIVRAILRRDAPVEHHGAHYDVPYTGPGATGLGKPLKLIVHPLRADVPIYLAAIGPRNVALTAEIADGWLPIFFAPQRADVFRASLEAGFARAGGGKSLADFDIAVTVPVVMGSDVAGCRMWVKPMLALYIGGMGARGKNFYHELARRYGYDEAADRIQDLYLAGRRDEAIAAVPDALVDDVALCGPRERIAERIGLWRDAGVQTMILGVIDPATLRTMAELVL